MFKILKIQWKRLMVDNKTCPRCNDTEQEITKAIETLKDLLEPFDIQILLKKEEITLKEFKDNPIKSNEIWINDKLLETWIGGFTGSSPCCDVCEGENCRTVNFNDKVYETIPAELIIKGCLIAASELIRKEGSCCKNDPSKNCCG